MLLNHPSDATALKVEKVAGQIAILTSLSDDDAATNLTLKILDAGAAGHTLNLANAHDLASILGIDITGITNKNDYPQPLLEIFDRNDNIAQAGNVGGIEAEWQDFLSIQDNVASTSIADLSIHVNQPPVGLATAALPDGTANTDYVVPMTDLMQGVSDPENNTLNVAELTADNGAVFDNGDGSFTISPNPDYAGPMELSYNVIDGQGGIAPANQLLVIAPIPCFALGTRIRAESGWVAVEDLRVGDRVLTRDGQPAPIVWIGWRQVDCVRHPKPETVWPVRVRRGAFGPEMPCRDLFLSPNHAVFAEEVLIPVKHLVNGTSVAQVPVEAVTYYHVELSQHDVVLAEGLPAESYLDSGDRANLVNGGDVVRLHPDFSSTLDTAGLWEALGYAPLVTTGEELVALRRRLARRAGRVVKSFAGEVPDAGRPEIQRAG